MCQLINELFVKFFFTNTNMYAIYIKNTLPELANRYSNAIGLDLGVVWLQLDDDTTSCRVSQFLAQLERAKQSDFQKKKKFTLFSV